MSNLIQPYEEACWNCQSRDYIPDKDRKGEYIPCPYCKGKGYNFTPQGEALLAFMTKHLGHIVWKSS